MRGGAIRIGKERDLIKIVIDFVKEPLLIPDLVPADDTYFPLFPF